jgi:hypothetical protein
MKILRTKSYVVPVAVENPKSPPHTATAMDGCQQAQKQGIRGRTVDIFFTSQNYFLFIFKLAYGMPQVN